MALLYEEHHQLFQTIYAWVTQRSLSLLRKGIGEVAVLDASLRSDLGRLTRDKTKCLEKHL